MSKIRTYDKSGKRGPWRTIAPRAPEAAPGDLGSGMASDAGRAISGRQLQIDDAVEWAVRGNEVTNHRRKK